MQSLPLLTLSSTAALLAACASPAALPPAGQVSAGADCAELIAALTRAEQDHSIALERRQHAWQAIVPFAVAAGYAKAKSEADMAAQQMTALQTQASELACLSKEG